MRRALLVFLLVAALAVVPVAYALLTSTPVVKTTRNEYLPSSAFHSSGDELITFAQSRSGKPFVYDAYLRRISTSGTTTVKLNTSGRGFAGGIDGSTVVYQVVDGFASDIRLYDVDTAVRSAPPAGVNTNEWEFQPRISGDWLLFGRQFNSGPERVVLFNLMTSEQRILAKVTRRKDDLFVGQLDGNWAVYTRCTSTCNVFRHNIGANTTAKVPKATGKKSVHQYAASVTPAGVVYLVRSGNGCAVSVRIVRFFGPSDPAKGTVIAAFPKGLDGYTSWARPNTDGSTSVFYDRRRCKANPNFDVYKLTDPAP